VRGTNIVGEDERASVNGTYGTVAVGFVETVTAEDVITHGRYGVDQCYTAYWADQVLVDFTRVVQTSEIDFPHHRVVGGVVLFGVNERAGRIGSTRKYGYRGLVAIWSIGGRHLEGNVDKLYAGDRSRYVVQISSA